MAYNCIIIEDDEIDRLAVASMARKHGFVDITGIYASAQEALPFLDSGKISIVFSDIDMPGINGLELRRKMLDVPVCIFITSYPDYAVESFELAAFDFLIKPVKTERFKSTMLRAKEYLDTKQKAALYEYSLGADTIFIKEGHNFIKIRLHEILYLEALKDYTAIVTPAKKFCVLSPIGNLLKEKNFASFIRVHRSYAVQKNLISTITPAEVMINNISIPVGRSYKDKLEEIKQSL